MNFKKILKFIKFEFSIYALHHNFHHPWFNKIQNGGILVPASRGLILENGRETRVLLIVLTLMISKNSIGWTVTSNLTKQLTARGHSCSRSTGLAVLMTPVCSSTLNHQSPPPTLPLAPAQPVSQKYARWPDIYLFIYLLRTRQHETTYN